MLSNADGSQPQKNGPESVAEDGAAGHPSGVPAKQFVRDLTDKQTVHSIFLARDKVLLTGKNGKSYLSLFLADASGAIDARIWDNIESMNESFQSGDMVRIKGIVQMFQGRKQLVVHRLEKAQAEDYQLADFVSSATRAPEDMMAELLRIAEQIEDRSIRQLTLDTLNDAEIRGRLLAAPAAKTIHHAYIGGLLEHILSICGIMRLLHAHYTALGTELRLDFMIFGAIFHDIGKIWELEVMQGISYTDKGKLIGHLVMAVELIERKASRILGFPEHLKDLLKHIVLSHHGKVEYGSPKTPMFLEAFIVAAVDDLDSKINTIDMFVKSERASGDRWSKFNQLFDRYFFLKSNE